MRVAAIRRALAEVTASNKTNLKPSYLNRLSLIAGWPFISACLVQSIIDALLLFFVNCLISSIDVNQPSLLLMYFLIIFLPTNQGRSPIATGVRIRAKSIPWPSGKVAIRPQKGNFG